MASFIDRIRTFFKERKGSRLILILLTALLLELVAALQYTYTRNLLIKEEERITRMDADCTFVNDVRPKKRRVVRMGFRVL